ncbi:hypothetical protein CHO01_25410 [Cellulomonas hominis]|uniref:Fatty acid desaturase n=1 Tax=Cellulomonas hominis TaxID=156981 RepID=A0A511FDU5_9CELL|nr:hypothetical protein [Cellulomonas hominis]MBB5472508.1 fatty acid desaturase [Cellulomonas hominis]NKY05878.1 hypothetical protein [Cellulomonas hominis]GEL47425.1 hypothetical protein CHO01_25410 [Cellulomonas hominis]
MGATEKRAAAFHPGSGPGGASMPEPRAATSRLWSRVAAAACGVAVALAAIALAWTGRWVWAALLLAVSYAVGWLRTTWAYTAWSARRARRRSARRTARRSLL